MSEYRICLIFGLNKVAMFIKDRRDIVRISEAIIWAVHIERQVPAIPYVAKKNWQINAASSY